MRVACKKSKSICTHQLLFVSLRPNLYNADSVLMTKHKKYMVIDFFADCGGLSLGLYQAGGKDFLPYKETYMLLETEKI